MLAEKLESLLENFEEEAKKKKIKIKDPRGVLIIVDRSFDLIAPIVHDYYY
jgi:Sec1 family